MNQTRYRYTEKPLTREEAIARRHREYEAAETEIARRKCWLAEAKQALRDLRRAPLATEIEIQEAVEPDEPGYEDLPHIFLPGKYQGDFSWCNIPKT